MAKRRQFIAGVVTVGTVSVAGCTGILGGSPEGAVEQYFEAGQEGDVEAMNEVLHPESDIYPIEEDDVTDGDITFVDAEEISPSELVERFELFDDEEDVEEELQDAEDEVGADNVAIVWVTFEEDGEEEEFPFFVVEDDGDWKLLL